MSLPDPKQQRSFIDVSFVAERLFGPTNRFRLFREKLLPARKRIREDLAELYCEENGRPAVEPVVMAGVSLLQFMEKLPDRQATEMVREHLGWKYALDLEIDDEGFHATSLVKFRNRLIENDKGKIVFDTVIDTLRDEGLVKKRSKQRLDSTHILGLVSAMSRLEVVQETIRLALEEIEKQDAQDGFVEWEHFQERYLFARVDFSTQTREKLKSKQQQAGEDALRLITWFGTQDASLKKSKACKLLKRVFDEQYEVSSTGPRMRLKEESGTVSNPHDPDAQWSTNDRRLIKIIVYQNL